MTRMWRIEKDKNAKMTDKLLHRELTGQIIGAAMTVLNELKPGLDEKLYENALVIPNCWLKGPLR